MYSTIYITPQKSLLTTIHGWLKNNCYLHSKDWSAISTSEVFLYYLTTRNEIPTNLLQNCKTDLCKTMCVFSGYMPVLQRNGICTFIIMTISSGCKLSNICCSLSLPQLFSFLIILLGSVPFPFLRTLHIMRSTT